MAAKGNSRNGRDRLEEAMAALLQNQATLVQNQAAFVAAHAEIEQRHAEMERRQLELQRVTDERIARIEAQMSQVIQVLTDHTRQLERLTEAIREKIGFRG